MEYYTPEHETLTEAQQSEAIERFKSLKFDKRVGLISVLLAAGIGSFALAWRGESSDRIYYCIKQPDQYLRCNDSNNRPFRLTKWHWEKWGNEGRPAVVIPNPSIAPDGVKANNSIKPLWSIAGFVSLAAAGYLFRTMQHQQKKLAIYEDIQNKETQAKAELQLRKNLLNDWLEVQSRELEAQGHLELISTEQATTLEQAEVLAKAEIQVTEIESKELLFEAETAGMTPEQKKTYMEFLRSQNTPYLSGSQTLEQTINPSNKIQETELLEVPLPLPERQESDPYAWMDSFLKSSCLVWGNQGGGKSWLVRYLVQEKVKAGYKVIIFDPNSNAYEWQGVELINTYEEIQKKMSWYVQEVMERYTKFGQTTEPEEVWRERLWREGKAYSIICEEMSTYKDFIDNTAIIEKFIKVGITLSRKQEMPVTFVGHNNTSECMGGIKGLDKIVQRMQQIQLIPYTDPQTKQPVASGKALIKYDGSNEWLEVSVPKIKEKIRNFTQSPITNHQSPLPQTIIPQPELSDSITRLLSILVDHRDPIIPELIQIIPTDPDKALWMGLKSLNFGVTAASKDIFNCGDGGKFFQQKAKPWYEALQERFGQIKETITTSQNTK